MRTEDFSRAPRLARAEALIVTDAVRSLRGQPGLVRERRWRERGRRGTIAWFETAAQAAAVAAALRPSPGFTHRYLANPSGYSNGVWRAETGPMAHELHFAPLTREQDRGVPGPVVADPDAPRHSKFRRRRATPHLGLEDARAMFVGATRYSGPLSIAIQSRTWFPMVRRMRELPGFRWIGIYWVPPYALGTIAFFRSHDDMMIFARIPEHRYLMRWIVQGTRHGRGGWIRIHQRVDDSPDGAAGNHAHR